MRPRIRSALIAGMITLAAPRPAVADLGSHFGTNPRSMGLGGAYVAVAEDGREALARAATQAFEVALIDLGMPDLPGDRVAEGLRQINPALAAILITGWELDEDDPRRAPFDYLVQKPFRDLGAVRRLVTQALRLHDERHGAATR